MRFTSEEAYEAQEDGEPIMLSLADTNKLIAQHQPGDDPAEFFGQFPHTQEHFDAATVLDWLGY
jgi:hypothetical protein